MSTKSVRVDLDLDNPPPLTSQQQAEVEALKTLSDDAIDYSEIPPLGDDFWNNAVRNPFCRPAKSTATVHLDKDVLVWLKSKGKGYQTRINTILREAMLKEMHTR